MIFRGCPASLLCSKAYQITNAKAYVFSDSLHRVGKMDPIATWKSNVKWYSENNHFQGSESNRRQADGVRVENIPRNHNVGSFREVLNLLKNPKCELEHFKDRITFMPVYNDITWGAKGSTDLCEYNSQTVANYARRFPRGHWSFLEPGTEKEWYGSYPGRPVGSWDKTSEQMTMNFSESSHPILRASSAFERG